MGINVVQIDNDLQEVINAWCTWCVNHRKFVPFEEWKRYTHGDDALKALMKFYKLGQYAEK